MLPLREGKLQKAAGSELGRGQGKPVLQSFLLSQLDFEPRLFGLVGGYQAHLGVVVHRFVRGELGAALVESVIPAEVALGSKAEIEKAES